MMKSIRIVASMMAVLSVATLVYASRPSDPVCTDGEAYSIERRIIKFCLAGLCPANTALRPVAEYDCLVWCCPENWETDIGMTDCVSLGLGEGCCTEKKGTRVDDFVCPAPPATPAGQ